MKIIADNYKIFLLNNTRKYVRNIKVIKNP